MHGERDKTRFGVNHHADVLAGGRELKRVTEQVPKDSVHASAIDPDGGVGGFVLDGEMNMLVVCLFLEVRAGLVD